MPKIKIEALLKSENEEHHFCGNAILKNNQITFLDNNINTCITIFDDGFVIKRKSMEYDLTISLSSKQKSSYLIKKIGILNVNVNIIKKTISNSKLYAEYSLTLNGTNMGKFTYLLLLNK